MANKKLKNSLKKFSGQKEEKLVTITGELGIPLGGQKIVEVPNRNGFVYVRLKSNTSEVIQAYNSEVSTIYGLPVLVARQGNIYKVIGRNLDRYRDWSDIPYLPKHGGQHSFNFSLGMGADVSWIYSQQFMPLLSYPSGTQGSMTLSLEPHFYEWQGQWRYAQNTGTPSYTPYLPTITGSARMVLSYIDPSDNSIKLVAGTPFSNTITGSAQIAPYIPDIPRSVGIPLAAVRLVTGTTAIGWGNIYDMRDFYTVSSGITGSAFGGIAIQDNGVPLGTGTALNFADVLDVSISGSIAMISTDNSGWIPHRSTWSYHSADSPSFVASVNANITGTVGVGDKLRLEQTSNKYFIVTAISITGSTSYVNMYGGTDYTLANAAITSPYYSHVKSPFGFPLSPAKWTTVVTNTSTHSQATPTASTWYNLGSISIDVPIGVWDVTYDAFISSDETGSATNAYVTLSTANNSESDAANTMGIGIDADTAAGAVVIALTFQKTLLLTLASKTTYYLNERVNVYTVNGLALLGALSTTKIAARCAYL